MEDLLGGLLKAIMNKEGAIFTMFAALVSWVMYTNDKRETRYIDTIDNLAGELSTKVTKIEDNVQDIKDAIFKPKI